MDFFLTNKKYSNKYSEYAFEYCFRKLFEMVFYCKIIHLIEYFRRQITSNIISQRKKIYHHDNG